MEIYTYKSTPFVLGKSHSPIKTVVEEYERINIGKGYYGILVKNEMISLYHMVLENCGAIIGTDSNRRALIASIKKDVATGDEIMMKQQIETGLVEIRDAELLSSKEFFLLFRGV